MMLLLLLLLNYCFYIVAVERMLLVVDCGDGFGGVVMAVVLKMVLLL